MATAKFSSFVYEQAIRALIASMKERSNAVHKTDQNHFAFHAWKAYLFAAQSLECIINEFLAMNERFLHAGRHFPVSDLQALKIQQKYVLIPVLFGVDTFD